VRGGLALVAVLVLLFSATATSIPLLPSSVQTRASNNTNINIRYEDPSWSDDFEGGNFSNWVTYGGYQGDDKIPGNFTIVDGALFAQEHTWNWAFHDSEVVTGTWSMDIYAVDREHHEILVAFILENHTLQDIWKNAYIVQLLTGPYRIWENDGLTLLRAITYPGGLTWFQYNATGELNGWQHLDITRDIHGQMCVYLNETPYITCVDNMITESTLFGVVLRDGQGFDNVTVTNNDITIDKVPPYWTTGSPGDVTIQVGEPLSYKLNATDTSGIDSFWVNDTTHFTVDNQGVLTNNTSLEIGTYGLRVSVNDTNGYTLSGSFNVIVQIGIPPPPPIPGFPFEAIILGLIACLGVIVVIRRRRTS
jgi:hypothetical protein